MVMYSSFPQRTKKQKEKKRQLRTSEPEIFKIQTIFLANFAKNYRLLALFSLEKVGRVCAFRWQQRCKFPNTTFF